MMPDAEGVAVNEIDVADEELGEIVPEYPLAVLRYSITGPEKFVPVIVNIVDCPTVALVGDTEVTVGAGSGIENATRLLCGLFVSPPCLIKRCVAPANLVKL